MPGTQEFWHELFGVNPPGGRCTSRTLRLVRKQGRPFLLLPARAPLAIATLSLYPAQTARARFAKTLLRTLLRLSLPVGTTRLELSLPVDAPFPRFLAGLGVAAPGDLPEFGVLAGNPAGGGQRLLVLLFEAHHQPARVVKAGLSPRARELVRKEAAFLAAAGGRRGIPKLRTATETAGWHALVLDYFHGDSPRRRHRGGLPAVLDAWVDPQRQTPLSAAPEWQRLEQLPAQAIEWLDAASLRGRSVSVTLQHGDFMPFNIKVASSGEWQVLDWERGELLGVPGWDWFHYVIQTAILVERLPLAGLVARVEDLLAGDPFKSYAAKTGIAGLERRLLLAYLVHCVELVRPAEGFDATRALLAALRARWAGVQG